MAKCPKCSGRLNFLDILTLSKLSNRILCSSCQTVLEANKSTLAVYGAVMASFLLLFMQNFENWFGLTNSLWILGSVVVVLVFLGMGYYFLIKLTVSKDQNRTDLEDTFQLTDRPELPENYTRTEYLKNRFFYKSNTELEMIATDPKRIQAAKDAAKELLLDRKSNTNEI